MDFQEDLIYDLFLHCCQLLNYCVLELGGTCPVVFPKYIQHTVEFYGFPHSVVNYYGNHIPDDLQKSNSADISTPFG